MFISQDPQLALFWPKSTSCGSVEHVVKLWLRNKFTFISEWFNKTHNYINKITTPLINLPGQAESSLDFLGQPHIPSERD